MWFKRHARPLLSLYSGATIALRTKKYKA